MRKLKAVVIALVVAFPIRGNATGVDDAFLPYAVAVNGGAGVYLGNGLILSVAHVVGGGFEGEAKDADCEAWMQKCRADHPYTPRSDVG